MHIRIAVAIGLTLGLAATAAQARGLSDAQVRQRIIRDAISSFHGACPCPYSQVRDRKGRLVRCGSRSAYRSEGANIQCYPKDVGDSDIDAWRSDHGGGR